MTVRRAGVLAATALLVLAACDGGPSGDETSATDPETDTTDAPLVVPGCDTTGTATFPRRSARAVIQPAFLNGVELTTDGCLDVVVFEFAEPGVGRGLPPGYVVEYRPGPFVVGEGEEMQELDIAGSAFLVVTLEASTRAFPGDPDPVFTYTGPTEFVPGSLNQLREMALVVETGDRMEWVIGLDEERPFLVDAAAGPPRVTVKIA